MMMVGSLKSQSDNIGGTNKRNGDEERCEVRLHSVLQWKAYYRLEGIIVQKFITNCGKAASIAIIGREELSKPGRKDNMYKLRMTEKGRWIRRVEFDHCKF